MTSRECVNGSLYMYVLCTFDVVCIYIYVCTLFVELLLSTALMGAVVLAINTIALYCQIWHAVNDVGLKIKNYKVI